MIDRPSEKEQEYFLRLELERIKKLREAHRAKTAEEERQRLKELHFMHCPKCGQQMELAHLGEIEVELCPDCGGVFLDAGELDKVVEDRHRERFSGALGRLRALWGA